MSYTVVKRRYYLVKSRCLSCEVTLPVLEQIPRMYHVFTIHGKQGAVILARDHWCVISRSFLTSPSPQKGPRLERAAA